MTRILLFLLFSVMLAADTLGLNLSLAPGLSIKNAFLYVIFAGIAVDTALKRNRRIELLSVIVPYGLCFLYASLTIVVIVLLIDYPRYEFLQAVIRLKGSLADNLLVFIVFFYGVLTVKDSLSLARMLLWSIVVVNLITVIDGFNIPDLGLISEREDGRIGGPIGEANQYAAFLLLFLPGIIALVLTESGIRRVLAVAGVAATTLALLMTASRGGFVGLIAGSAFAAFLLRRYISPRAAISALGVMVILSFAAVGVMYATGYGDLLYDRVISLSTEGNSFDVTSGRTFIWGSAMSVMLDQPVTLITGYGLDTYRQFPNFRFAPHNTYLNYYFELGVIGLLLVLVTFANVFRTARKGLGDSDSETGKLLIGFIFGLMGILVAIFFVDIDSPWLFLWAYVGTMMRLAVLQNDKVIQSAGEKRVAGRVRSSVTENIQAT